MDAVEVFIKVDSISWLVVCCVELVNASMKSGMACVRGSKIKRIVP